MVRDDSELCEEWDIGEEEIYRPGIKEITFDRTGPRAFRIAVPVVANKLGFVMTAYTAANCEMAKIDLTG